jgi:hypothetical protein
MAFRDGFGGEEEVARHLNKLQRWLQGALPWPELLANALAAWFNVALQVVH